MNGPAWLALVLPLAWVGFVYVEDKYDREPVWALALAVAGGAVAALALALAQRWVTTPSVAAMALIEESLKLGVLLIAGAALRACNEPLDGIVYAVSVASGFAAAENVLLGGALTWHEALLRLAPATAHAAFAAPWGVAYGLVRFKRRHWGWIVAALLAAAGGHWLFNLLAALPWGGWVALVPLVPAVAWLVLHVDRLLRHPAI